MSKAKSQIVWASYCFLFLALPALSTFTILLLELSAKLKQAMVVLIVVIVVVVLLLAVVHILLVGLILLVLLRLLLRCGLLARLVVVQLKPARLGLACGSANRRRLERLYFGIITCIFDLLYLAFGTFSGVVLLRGNYT